MGLAQDINSGRAAAISMGIERTFRLREVFSKSFNVFGRHVVAFIILSAIGHIPFLFLYLWPFTVARYAPRAWFPFLLLAEQVVYFIGVVCALIAYGAIIYGVIRDLAGRPVLIAEAVAIAARRLLPLLGVSAAVVAFTTFGGLKFIIVLLMYWLVMGMYFVAAPVCIGEQAGVGATLSRCRFLTKGHRWQIFLAILLVGSVGSAFNNIGIGLIFAGSWGAYAAILSVWIVFGAYTAVVAAVFYHSLRLAKDDVHIAKVFD
jgi:hypothetical protein